MSTPQIPPRPMRAYQQQQQQQQMPTGLMNTPKIPPRPVHRAVERSQSPSRDNFPRSPLNDLSFSTNPGPKNESLSSNHIQNGLDSTLNLPQRPPSVSLPSIGQEGNEYADIVYEKSQDATADADPEQSEPEQTRNVGSDLPLHAPRPSLTESSAKARVSAVTRTDSSQAAAAGIGKALTPVSGDDKNPQTRGLRSKVSFSGTESSASTERPNSAQAGDSDHGIPEIGQRVPMHPDAGDVQAPSPSPFSQNFPSGASSHSDGAQKPGRHHSRTRSGKEVFRGPPGSYGMHGHGVLHNDQFEKAWYDKHPDALVREECGQYGPGVGGARGEWALSSEDLNKIVRDTARRGSGFGTSATVAGLPNEQIGYMASEEYTSRINSPSSATYYHKAHSNHSQTHVESPLRKASFPVDTEAKDTFEKTKESQILRSRSEYALESETEDDEIHINAPTARISKYSGNGYDPPTEDLGPHGGNTEAEGGWIEETGYGVPILASDEVAKEPGSEYLQPAVSPVQERRGSAYYAGVDLDAPASYMSGHRNGSRSGSATNSRPSSRPGSVHGTLPGLSRFTSHDEREDIHTPLEDVDEYEPLFPEEEGEKEDRPVSAIDRFKHREMMKRRFPSQDIWEDTPNSLQLQATVETPEPAEEHVAPIPKDSAAAFESPETEAARKGEVNEEEKTKLIPREERLAKSNFKPHLYEGASRPGLKQRFPSRDIWEDSPDHAHLETTVREHQEEEARIPADEGLESGAVVHAAGRPDEPKVTEDTALDGTHTKAQKFERPSIPPRPARTNMSGGSVSSGDQPVPSVPARPPKRFHQVPPADIPHRLSKTLAEISPTELNDGSPSENRKPPGLPDRPKPQIPTRPARSGVRKEPEMAPLSKSTSVNSTSSVESKDENRELMSSPTAPKNKPALPSRSVGGKIASLKAGFLSDLDKRLQLGPQGSKPQEKAQAETEVQEDKAPLPDARKSRAKGPARRKPAAPSTLMATNILEGSTQEKRSDRYKWSIQDPWTVWQTEDDGSINAVHAARTGLMEEQADNALAPRNQSLQQQAVETSPRYMKSPEDATSPTKEASNEDQAGSGNGMAASTGYDLASASPQKETSVTAFSDKELTPPASSPPSEIYHTMSNATSQVDEKPSPISPATSRDDKPTADVIG